MSDNSFPCYVHGSHAQDDYENTNKISAEKFASMLNGREYRNEMTPYDEKLAKDRGFIVVFGASDDLTEFRGLIDDEIGSYEGADHFILSDGTFADDEYFEQNRNGWVNPNKRILCSVLAVWSNDIPWKYITSVKNHKFNIMENGEVYCEGIVLDIRDMI